MSYPEKGICIIIGEMSMVVSTMRHANRTWSHIHEGEEPDSLMKNFIHLKESINSVESIDTLQPVSYLSPFLDVIRSENTSGLITGCGLSAVYKFLMNGLIDIKNANAAVAAENIADAVTHARFTMVDSSSDEVVLLKIIQVLRLLLLTPIGTLLTNEAVCEIIQSFFRMCFETRFSEILRKTAESALVDAVQLLFSRLPQFTEDLKSVSINRECKMHSNVLVEYDIHKENLPHCEVPKISNSCAEKELMNTDEAVVQNEDKLFDKVADHDDSCIRRSVLKSNEEADIPDPVQFDSCQDSLTEVKLNEGLTNDSKYSYAQQNEVPHNAVSYISCNQPKADALMKKDKNDMENESQSDYINPRGIRFTPQLLPENGFVQLMPYGLACVREMFRLLISLISPRDRHCTEMTVQTGLSLLTVSLEAGADHLGRFESLLSLVKDEMCRNLFALLSSDKLAIFASTMRVFFLLFEALRTHLKFQLEMFLHILMDMIVSESMKISYEKREMALDCITQLLHIPGFVTELYINYDSSLYCSNLVNDLTKLLAKNASPLSSLQSVHLLSLDTLLAVIYNIENHCNSRMLNESKFSPKKEILTINKYNTCLVMTSNILQEISSDCLMTQQDKLTNHQKWEDQSKGLSNIDSIEKFSQQMSNRVKNSSSIPSHEELMAIKHKKEILASGTQQFNSQPSKGITFLQEHGLLRKPLDPEQVATFLRENPQLDKKMIGEYISNRHNLNVLEAFVRSFSFEGTRIDEALRQYLEAFRLPGEALLISLIMEHFAEHWHKSNSDAFVNSDAAFTLAYAVILLNVDQHNHNVKKQNNPMTLEDFKKNLRKVNGGQDFDEELLEKIYNSIKNEEIVMPAEQTGLVRENYHWKVLLRRGSSKEGYFVHAADGSFDHELFSLVWGPTVAALSFIFDKSSDLNIIQKTINGFQKCAVIAAYYGMSNVFDNLVITLCKFTSLVNTSENIENLPISFGNNAKAQMATKAVFQLAHCHGDILREGWKNILDCILNLFKGRLLPENMIKAEDFVDPSGMIPLIKEDVPVISRSENSGLFSSFYSYITSDSLQKTWNQEDEIAKQIAIECITQCHCDQLFAGSKFLRIDSLLELVKTLMYACPSPDPSSVSINESDEASAVFFLEILVRVVILNRDRILSIWTGIQEHLFNIVINAATSGNLFLLERSVVGMLRIAIQLVRKEEMIPQVMQALQIILVLERDHLIQVSRQVAYAFHEMLKTNASNVHAKDHWAVIFCIFERVGTGAKVPVRTVDYIHHEVRKLHCKFQEISTATQCESELTTGYSHTYDSGFFEKGCTSDSEQYDSSGGNTNCTHNRKKYFLRTPGSVGSNVTWILVDKNEVENQEQSLTNQYDISLHQEFSFHDSSSFLKCCESLLFLVRDAAHITPENFEACVHCLRTFLEASASEGCSVEKKVRHKVNKEKRMNKSENRKKKNDKMKHPYSRTGEGYNADDDEKYELFSSYQHISLQLLDSMYTLHTCASSLFGNKSIDFSLECEEISTVLWSSCWLPLLQGIAHLCCDARKPVRTSALTLLPRALLIPDMQLLRAAEWESCFNKVLFPLLAKLLEIVNLDDPLDLEETRMRSATLLCKVFLQHLTSLLTLPTFMALWLTVLDFMDKYMRVDHSGLLAEAIPESLKNMLLVMDTARVFPKLSDETVVENDQMWNITWDRINAFLPNLQHDLFGYSNSSFMNSVPTGDNLNETSRIPISSIMDASDGVEQVRRNAGMNLVSTVEILSSTSVTMEQEPSVVSSTVILHPPVSTPVSTIVSSLSKRECSNLSSKLLANPVSSSSAVPLLLNPSVMGDSDIQMFNTQL